METESKAMGFWQASGWEQQVHLFAIRPRLTVIPAGMSLRRRDRQRGVVLRRRANHLHG